MNGAVLLLIAMAVFAGGYFWFSEFLGRLLGIDFARKTPAHALRDDMDYVPAHPTVLFGHHLRRSPVRDRWWVRFWRRNSAGPALRCG